MTINYVLSRKDIVPYNKDSMEEFLGTEKKLTNDSGYLWCRRAW